MGKKKGWFVVYSVDRRRYALPLELLEKEMFVEMLKMAEEEFGLSNHQPIVFPFDSSVMDRILDVLLGNKQHTHQDEAFHKQMMIV
ncbi:Auxin-responsive protein SAUR65 [Linum grandiflorum]